MSIDHELIRSLSSFEDERLGIRERFLMPELEGTRTVAVLSTALGAARPYGWLLCGSFGPEEAALSRFRIELARDLAAAGFPVLRYQARGYAESQDRGTMNPGPGSQLADAIAAARVLRTEAGVRAIGVVGAGFGGAMAALAAAPADAASAVLIQPVTHGRTFLRSLAVRALAVDAGHDQRLAAARRGPVLDLDGFAVPREVADELQRLDVVAGVEAFRGRSLIVEVGRTDEVGAASSRLALALGSGEGRCTIERVVHPDAHRFGLPRIRKTPGRGKTDVQAELSASITGPVVGWCTAIADTRATEPVGA